MEYAEDPFLFPLVTEHRSRWEKAGLSPRQERSFNRVSTLLVALFVTGWLYSIFLAPPEDLMAGRPPVARVSSRPPPRPPPPPPPPAGGADQLRAGALAAHAGRAHSRRLRHRGDGAR